jgi:hypothetical protein
MLLRLAKTHKEVPRNHAARSPEAPDDGRLPGTLAMPSTILRPGAHSSPADKRPGRLSDAIHTRGLGDSPPASILKGGEEGASRLAVTSLFFDSISW